MDNKNMTIDLSEHLSISNTKTIDVYVNLPRFITSNEKFLLYS